MILLLPGNTHALVATLNNLNNYGWLLTAKRTMTKTGLFGCPYAVDNEMFTGRFTEHRFIAALERIRTAHGVNNCHFVVAPDIPFDAPGTLARFPGWADAIHQLGFPVALAAQDGLERHHIPWNNLDALFIGGSTTWKLSPMAATLIEQARARGKWTHVGRVNSVYRASRLPTPPDSIDGTAWAKHPAHYAHRWQQWTELGQPCQPPLL